MAICKRAWNNLRPSFSEFGTLLAWFAIFLWLADFTWRFTGLDGLTNTFIRLVAWNWLNWKPIVGGAWYMFVASGFYWVGAVMVIVVFILLVRKIFTKHKEDESLNNLSNEMRDMKESITKSIDSLINEVRLDRENKEKGA